uniref:Protein kinase domain-containing protein n=1 Tax=Bursaphelenchus xylophilus TaxID=6326 RepID=A0A1I7SJL9_BURXY
MVRFLLLDQVPHCNAFRAVGICTLELLYGTIPFERNPNPDVEEEIAALQKMNTVRDVNWNRMYANGEQLRKKLSKHCKDFIDSCLKLNPADRPTVSELFVQKFWMLQPPIPNAELFEKLLGTCGEDNLKYLLEKKHRRKLEEHRRMNNNPANPIKLLKHLIMCISLSLGSSQERFFKKFVVKTSFHEKEAESLFHEMLFGYLYDEQINLYDFIYISTGAIKAFRRVKELDAKVKRGSRVREDESTVAAAEKPEVVDLQDGGKCVISWHKELFLDNASPTANGERPEAPPRQRRISRNR